MDLNNQLQEFLVSREIDAVVAFSGGSEEEEGKIRPIIEEGIDLLKDYSVAILTGGTTWSVQKMANDTARKAGMPTIGILPDRGKKYLNPEVDLPLVIPPRMLPSEWGDDSEVFAKSANGVVMIGGGFGTFIEFGHIMKINESRLRHPEEGKPIHLAPISGIGGFSDRIKLLELSTVLRSVLPLHPIFNGKDAAKFIIGQLGLDTKSPQ